MKRHIKAPLYVCAEPDNATAMPLTTATDAITFRSTRRSFVKRVEKFFGPKVARSQPRRWKRPYGRLSHQPGAILMVHMRQARAVTHHNRPNCPVRSTRSVSPRYAIALQR
jgi:hypothetical protein